MNDSTVRTLDFVRAIDAGALSDGRFTGNHLALFAALDTDQDGFILLTDVRLAVHW